MMTNPTTKTMDGVRYNTMRNVAAEFLNNTKALHIDRDLATFLLEMDLRHREEVYMLNKAGRALHENGW